MASETPMRLMMCTASLRRWRVRSCPPPHSQDPCLSPSPHRYQGSHGPSPGQSTNPGQHTPDLPSLPCPERVGEGGGKEGAHRSLTLHFGKGLSSHGHLPTVWHDCLAQDYLCFWTGTAPPSQDPCCSDQSITLPRFTVPVKPSPVLSPSQRTSQDTPGEVK